MKCPLKCIGDYSLELMRENPAFECLKEECAWWVKASERCAMEAIPRVIGFVGSELHNIASKTPLRGR